MTQRKTRSMSVIVQNLEECLALLRSSLGSSLCFADEIDEDIKDLKAARKAMKEAKRKGTVSLEEICSPKPKKKPSS